MNLFLSPCSPKIPLFSLLFHIFSPSFIAQLFSPPNSPTLLFSPLIPPLLFPFRYIQTAPGTTIRSTLDHEAFRNAPFLTHGCYLWTTEFCLKDDSDEKDGKDRKFLVERTVYRNRTAYCLVPDWRPEMCWDAFGHRKLFLNPRKVNMTQVHNVKDVPGEAHFEVNAQIWHAHFPGIGSGFDFPKICANQVEAGKEKDFADLDNFVMDSSIARLVPAVRACPLGSKKVLTLVSYMLSPII